MIHILDFNDNIIDFISRNDGALIKVEMTRNVQEVAETLDFTILSERADNVRERNRVIAQDYNGVYREFIITHVEDDLEGLTDVQCNASYLEDLATAKPLKPQTFEKMSTTQALLKTLADTGWEVSDETEYGGMRSKSWTSYNNPYQVVGMLETTYDMVADFYIELGSHTVEHRYVSLKHPNSLFKGKEIVKGKDLTGLTRTVDTSEVRTALIALGPEDEQGNRISTIVKDDEAHEQFGLPGRYLWDIYEPESEDTNMTLERLTTLAKTELNKRKQMSVSYEISALDIHRYYNDVQVELRDKVRVKDRDFNPPLYVEAEVLAFTYNLILDDTTFTFGNVVEFEEDTLRQEFTRRLDEIRKKLQDDISNVNTIVNDAVEGQLEYFEPKIIKSDTAPKKPVEDMLWYDTSNPNVAVLRRYVNGEWRNETAKDVEQLGGMTREKVLYNSLTNTFTNLNIQHSKLLDEVYKLLNNEYLVDDDLRLQLNNATDNLINVYNNIETNLDSMTPETATIGKLIDTQALFVRYRERLQDLYKAMRNAQIAADDRLKLLQSQYTDEKFNDAMNKIAETLPNGRWDSENQRLYADIPNRNDVNNVRQALQEYTDGQISNLNSVLGKEIDSKINTTKSEISASISSVEQKIDGIEVGGRNLIRNSEKITDYIILSNVEKAGTYSLGFEPHFTENIPSEFGVYYGGNIDTLANDKPRITHTFEVGEDRIGKDIRLFFGGTYTTHKDYINNGYVGNVKLEYGNFATDYTPAPEDLQNKILVKSQEVSKAQADAAETRAQAYADSKITNEEQARIRQADANLQLLQQQQQSLKDEMAAYTDNLINEEERARIDADAAKEEALKAEINLAQTQANAYADDKITAEEERAIKDAENKLKEAKLHAEETAEVAQQLAQNYALTQAQTAQTEAEKAAQTYADAQDELKQTEIQAYADGIVSDEEKRAIADTIAKRDEAKEYAEQKAQEAQEAANQNTSNQLEPITTRITKNETNITELDEQISLMAKSDDVAQKLRDVDGRLTPLETTVESNKATLDILPTQIESKVSKKDYTTDKNEIVQRLDNADSNRIQLANKIEDRVTITEYNSGIDSVKSTNRNYIQSYYSPSQNIVNGSINGAYSVTLNTSRTLNFYFYDRGAGTNPTLEQNTDYILKIHEADINVKAGVFYKKGSYSIVGYTTDKVIRFNTKDYQDIRIVLTPTADNQFIGKVSLYKGSKELDWTPAPEDIEILAKKSQQDAEEAQKAAQAYADAQDNLKETKIKAYADGIVNAEEQRAIQDAESKLETAKQDAQNKASAAQTAAEEYAVIKANNAETNAKNDATTKANKAEANAKAYTDAYKQNNDVAMTKLETSISQLDGKVSIKVDEQKFNASQKTLSKVLTEIAATTSGINLTYDNNGAIQAVTVDNGGVKLRGDKVDITVNDAFRVMANRVSNVQSDVSNKVGKDDIINRLNLSPEGLDIDVSKIGIRGGDNVDYIDIRDNSILSYGRFTRTWANVTDTANLRLGIQGGTVKIQNQTTGYNLYLTEKGLSTMLAGAGDETAGTLEFHSTKYNDTSRGVRLHSTYGAVALESDYSRIILNANLTVNIESNYGIYFRPYRDNRTGNNEFAMYVKQNDSGAYTDGVIKYGNISSETSQYGSGLRFSKSSVDSVIYATNKDGDIGTGDFYGNKLYGALTAKETNAYVLVDDELRITNKKGYNNGNVNYKDLRANSINTTHSYAFANHSGSDVYFGVGYHELRITANNFWNGGNPSYQNIRFGKWYAMSSEKFKYDIKEWNYSVLDAFRNDLQLYSFKHNSDKESNYIRNHHGVIIERELPIEWRHGDGIDGNEIMFWNTKAIQEVIAIVDEQNGKINKLEEEIKWLKTKI